MDVDAEGAPWPVSECTVRTVSLRAGIRLTPLGATRSGAANLPPSAALPPGRMEGAGRDCPGNGRILLQAQMTAILVIVRHKFTHQSLKLSSVHDHDLVQQLPAQGSAKPIHMRILPRRPRRRPHRLHAQVLECPRHGMTILASRSTIA